MPCSLQIPLGSGSNQSVPPKPGQVGHFDPHPGEPAVAIELRQTDEKGGPDNLGAGLPQKFDSRDGSSAGGDQIVDEKDALSGYEGILMHLHRISPILKLIAFSDHGVRKLTLLTQRHKAR